MTHIRSCCVAFGVLVLLGCLVPASATDARDELPLGHPDFYPSPQRPIGWRGDGNRTFPGTTLVSTFSEGELKYADATPKFGRGTATSKPYVDFEVGGRKNILWKIPLPGLTQSQPIVVGDRVIQTCEPRTILCLDLRSGKEIWRRELDPFAMIGVTGKGREDGLLLESTAWILHAISKNLVGNYTRIGEDTPKERKKWAATLARVRTVLEGASKAYPDLVKTPLANVAKAEKIVANTKAVVGKGKADPNRVAIIKAVAGAHGPLEPGFLWPLRIPCHLSLVLVGRLDLADPRLRWDLAVHPHVSRPGRADFPGRRLDRLVRRLHKMPAELQTAQSPLADSA